MNFAFNRPFLRFYFDRFSMKISKFSTLASKTHEMTNFNAKVSPKFVERILRRFGWSIKASRNEDGSDVLSDWELTLKIYTESYYCVSVEPPKQG